ncbi:MAG TPA: hypothetical protein VLL54_16165 [Pyrinomonadaceae bacterium]|nr:hypothetical protein [Pyrinomonadaceae bacterium]
MPRIRLVGVTCAAGGAFQDDGFAVAQSPLPAHHREAHRSGFEASVV